MYHTHVACTRQLAPLHRSQIAGVQAPNQWPICMSRGMASGGASDDELECLGSLLRDGAGDLADRGGGHANKEVGVNAETQDDESDGEPSAAGSDGESVGDGCGTEDEETPGVASPTAGPVQAVRSPGAAKTCASGGVVFCVCTMTDKDPDMADNSEQRSTPFGCLGSGASNSSSGAYAVCGHCESLLRYRIGARSAAAIVQQHRSNPSAKAQ